MSTTYTANTKLAQPALGDTGWSTPLNNNCDDARRSTARSAAWCVTTNEVPSTTLNVAVAAGTVVAQDGTTVTYAGTSSQAITASTTKVLYLDGTRRAGGRAAYPTTPHVRLATVVAGSSTITSITDNRQCFNVAGSIADGVNLTFGTATGTKIGTATSQKIGFFGKTPIVQPTMGAATAGGTYTATEQAMLQAVYNACAEPWTRELMGPPAHSTSPIPAAIATRAADRGRRVYSRLRGRDQYTSCRTSVAFGSITAKAPSRRSRGSNT